MSDPKNLSKGEVALFLGGAVLMLGYCGYREVTGGGGSSSPAAATMTQQTNPALDEAVAFLQSIERPFTSAEHECEFARRCGVVDKSMPETGAVGTLAEIRPCIAERLPRCEARFAEVTSRRPPASIAGSWPGVVRYQIESSLEKARVLRDYVQARKRLPQPPKQFNASLLDVIREKDGDLEKRLLAASMMQNDAIKDWQSLESWLVGNGACNGERKCGISSVMKGDPIRVATKYARR